MKKAGILVLLILTLGFTSCNKDDDNIKTEKEKYTVEYAINSNESTSIFNIAVIYKDKEGKDKSITVTEFPWKVSFEVEAPFVAKLSGNYSAKGGVIIPENVTIAKDAHFKITTGESLVKYEESKSKTTMSKSKFEDYVKVGKIGFNFYHEIK